MYDDITHELIQKLQMSFPVTFPEKPRKKKALKVDIIDELMPYVSRWGYTRDVLDNALKYWKLGKRYEKALKLAEVDGMYYGVY